MSSNVLTYGPLMLIAASIVAGGLIYLVPIMMEKRKPSPHQGVVKRDWLATGRIDFATKANAKADQQPSEFKLLVEEHRIVESVAGNENLEIQWRLATLAEAKAVITQYHRYLSENSLIKSISDDSASSPKPMTVEGSPSDSA